jgi:NAD+ kinase
VGDLDLLIALGGDGTVLRAGRLAIPNQIPVLAVALGRLSFMAELSPDELADGLRVLLDGGGWRDERALIEASIERDGAVLHEFLALNEVLVDRGSISRVVIADVYVDDALLTTYHADGVMVSTATGSTAYALAAGGPIVDPRSHALVLASVAAHLTNVPSMVLHEDARVRIILRSRHPAELSVDGRENHTLLENDLVSVHRSAHRCIFARVHPPTHFYANLSRRLRRE